MRCNTGQGFVSALGSQVQNVRGVCWESWGNAGRSLGDMWCFGMRHFAPWWMMVLCVVFASFEASSRVGGGTLPITGRTDSCFEPVGVYGIAAAIGCGVVL